MNTSRFPSFQKTGVLLVNVGTPQSPSTKHVRQYLREFLSDPRVIDIPWIFRFLLLYCIILPFRSSKSAKLYKAIWTDQGSPLLVNSQNFQKKVQEKLGDSYVVALAMAYQNPSIESALRSLAQAQVDRVLICPLFPQYASATTGAVLEKTARLLFSSDNIPAVATLPPFFDDKGFIESYAVLAKPMLNDFKPDHIVFSYHGLPQRQVDRSGTSLSFRYDLQCEKTTNLLAHALGLEQGSYTMCFQSKLGRAKWTEPNLVNVLPDLKKAGHQKIAILCPSFVADCLETIEEIGVSAKEQWMNLGGQDFLFVHCLNDRNDWVNSFCELIFEKFSSK